MSTVRSLQTSELASETKCDFCDLILSSDLEVAIHLGSEAHSMNRSTFLNKYIAQKPKESNIPINLEDTLHSLKALEPDRLRSLVNRNFFKIHNDFYCQLGEQFATSLVKAINDYEINYFPPAIKDAMIKVLQEPDNPPPPTNEFPKPCSSSQMTSANDEQLAGQSTDDLLSHKQGPTQASRTKDFQQSHQNPSMKHNASSPSSLSPISRPTTTSQIRPPPAPSSKQSRPGTSGQSQQKNVPTHKGPERSKRKEPANIDTPRPASKKTKPPVQTKPIDTGFIKPKTIQAVPDKEFSYVPVISRIKFEPKDD